MVVMLIAGLSVVGSIIYTRQSMELNKQQLSALHYCRRALERATSLSSVTGGTVTLVPFNSPGLEVAASIRTQFFPFNADGSVNWSDPALEIDPNVPEEEQSIKDLNPLIPYLCRVTVSWTPSGSWSALPQNVSMQTVVRKGVR